MSDNFQQTDQGTTIQGPGRLLKAGREKLGLTQKEVASQLNLQTDIIDAVENEAKERLPASTYVRGYIRNYAKIVNLDAEELIKLYENDAAAPPEIVPEIKSHVQATSTDKPVKAVTYLITFALVLLLIAWLQSQYVVDKESGAENTDNTTGSTEEFQELPAYPSSTMPQTDAEEYIEEPMVGPGLSLTIQEPLPGISESIAGTIELPATSSIETPDNILAEEQDSENIEALLHTEDVIKFKLTRESWIEVYDSGNQRLFMGLVKPGDDLTVSGAAPFDVLLGYSPGVEVRYNGEIFNTDPHSRSGIARFKLGDEDDQENQE